LDRRSSNSRKHTSSYIDAASLCDRKIRTIYLIDRVLTLDTSTNDPRQLAEGLLALVGDDMNAHRCSLMLRTPDGEALYIAQRAEWRQA
jgi:hypothetical protein